MVPRRAGGLLLAVPALTSEWALGRSTRSGPVLAFRQAFGRRVGTAVALALLFSAFMAACYYSIVVANVLFSAGFAARHGFDDASQAAYAAGLARNGLQYLLALAVVLSCLFIVHRGLRHGIEAVTEHFPMAEVNEALDHLRAGKARYRIVLDN